MIGHFIGNFEKKYIKNYINLISKNAISLGCYNILSIKTAEAEIFSIASLAKTCKKPLLIVSISWPDNEYIDEQNVKIQVKKCMNILNLDDCLCFWGLHKNGQNYVVKIAILRTDPKTLRPINAANGWIKRALYNGFYLSTGDNNLRSSGSSLSTHERATGIKNFSTILRDRISLHEIMTWSQFHSILASHGAYIQKVSRGAVISIGDQMIRASSLGKDFSFRSLEKRIGPFVAPDISLIRSAQNVDLITQPVDILMNSELWPKYRAESKVIAVERNECKKKISALREKHRVEMSTLLELQKSERTNLFTRRSWSGHIDDLRARRSILAKKHRRERKIIHDKYASELAGLKNRLKKQMTYAAWLLERGEIEEYQRWRFKADPERYERSVSHQMDDFIVSSTKDEIESLRRRHMDKIAQYRRLLESAREHLAALEARPPRTVMFFGRRAKEEHARRLASAIDRVDKASAALASLETWIDFANEAAIIKNRAIEEWSKNQRQQPDRK